MQNMLRAYKYATSWKNVGSNAQFEKEATMTTRTQTVSHTDKVPANRGTSGSHRHNRLN